MYWRIAFGALCAASAMGQSFTSYVDINKKVTQVTAGCEDHSLTAYAQKNGLQVASGRHHENVVRELERMSDLDFLGHPAPLIGLLLQIEHEEDDDFGGWNIRVIVDEKALARHRVQLDELVPGELRAGGVSRRSSLRFVFDKCGLGYYVGDRCLVVTTTQLSRAKWLDQLPKPNVLGLSDVSVSKRRDVAFSAGFWCPDPDTWIKPLARALTDSDRDVCFDAAYALGELGPQADKAITPLVSLLRSKDLTLRDAAVFALGKIGPKATKSLLELIDDQDSDIALAAAKSLGVMGSVGNAAVPALIDAGKRHADAEGLCDRIASSIGAVDLGDAIPRLRELLKSDTAGIRAFAANALGEIGARAEPCGPELLPLLTDQTMRVRIAAAHALARINLSEDFPTPALEAAAKDSDLHVSLWAKEALRVIKSGSKKGMRLFDSHRNKGK